MAGLATSFGSGAMTNSIHEIGDAECILAIGTNTTEAHPVIGLEPVRAAKNGKKLIIANPREIKLNRYATMWLRQKPGTDVALIMGMARVIVDEGLSDSAFVASRCENYDAFRESLRAFDLDTVSKITGVPAADIARAARMYATSKPATILYAMGITQHSHGTDNVLAIANLAMLTGNIGKPSTGVNPLRGQNNVQGACDMGALPNVYPAYQAVTDTNVKKKFEEAWGRSLSGTAGLTLPDIFEAIHKGQIKALYVIGENPVLTDPDASHVRGALEKLELLVAQDIFLNETAQMAHVVLPAASFAEKEGTFTNTERRVQRVRKFAQPIGQSKPDWWITCQIAKRMGGKGFDYQSSADIMAEISRVTPSYAGITYERLENGSLQWPCPTQEHPGTPVLHTEIFTRGKGRFMPLEYKAAKELPDGDFPLVLTTKRSLYHYHAGTMTHKVSSLNTLLGEGLVEINPFDAATMSIKDGEMVSVISRRGSVRAKAKLSGLTPAGVVSMDFHFPDTPTNVITNPALDPVSKIPEFKVAAVRIERSI